MSSSLKSRRKVGELQGTRRPSHLMMIRNETRRIQKPARKPPVIIYMVSPKIIHVEASEFMALVQRLTGPESSATDQSSPAGTRRFPVRVKARVLTTHSGGSESAGAISTQNHPSLSSVLPVSPMMLHDSSPPSSFGKWNGTARAQKEGSLASQSRLLRGDYSSQGAAGLPSSSGYALAGSPLYNYLDIYHQ